jgi:succinate-acetate transporter protein
VARELTSNMVLYGSITVNTIIGIEGVICGLSAVYLAFAEVLNEAQQKTVLPISSVS